MSFLAARHREPELMDQPGLSEREHRAALAGLRRVNLLSTSVGQLWEALRRHSAALPHGTPLRVLDVACGGGDVAVRLAGRARRARISMTIHGCDMSDTALAIARENAAKAGETGVEFLPLNVFTDPFPADYDVIMCSLFLHHLDEADAVRVLRAMGGAARRAVFVDDLLRTTWGYVLCQVGCRLLSRSPIVHVDGPLSVRGAFTEPEVRGLADEAGLTGHSLKRHWPERFLLEWTRS